MRRRVMMNSNNIPGKKDAVAGDILCAKEDGSKIIFKAADYADINGSGWTPIGVVIIPPSHDVYGTGEGAAVSLKYMCYNTPDEGSTSASDIYWGQNNIDTSLTNFNRVNTTDNATNPTITIDNFAYLPSDNFTDIQCITDPIAYYIDTATACIPSPYLSDGSRNEDYYTTEYTDYNALSDFDGIGNTDVLCSLATTQYNWRTATTINNNYGSGYSPAACCCWRYHTIGTNQGDWYLPAMGELGYLMVRLKTINNSISNVNGTPVATSNYFWSSSEFSVFSPRNMDIDNGLVNNRYKKYYSYVRSFVHF